MSRNLISLNLKLSKRVSSKTRKSEKLLILLNNSSKERITNILLKWQKGREGNKAIEDLAIIRNLNKIKSKIIRDLVVTTTRFRKQFRSRNLMSLQSLLLNRNKKIQNLHNGV